MTNSPRSPSTKSTKSHASLRDTGFPEPFNGERNTTLPHPDANLSPDAVISQDDINSNRVMARTRRSFLHGKHKRTISHGVITPQMAAMYGDLASDADSTAILENDAAFTGSLASLPMSRPSKDGGDSLLSQNGGDLSPVTSEQGRRSSLFRKLGWRK